MATADASRTKTLTVYVFGNPNSGKADLLASIARGKPSNTYTLASNDTGFTLSRQGLDCRVYNWNGEVDKLEVTPPSSHNQTAILFIADCSAYAQPASSLPNSNAATTRTNLHADLDLYSYIANSAPLATAPIILLLTHTTQFLEKLEVHAVPMRDIFPDYMDSPDFLAGVEYVTSKFIACSPRAGSQIYAHAVSGNQNGEMEGSDLDFLFQCFEDIV